MVKSPDRPFFYYTYVAYSSRICRVSKTHVLLRVSAAPTANAISISEAALTNSHSKAWNSAPHRCHAPVGVRYSINARTLSQSSPYAEIPHSGSKPAPVSIS